MRQRKQAVRVFSREREIAVQLEGLCDRQTAWEIATRFASRKDSVMARWQILIQCTKAGPSLAMWILNQLGLGIGSPV